MTIQEWGVELRSQIHDPQDYPLFDELIGCLEANFLRSAYIMSWIGIAENLKSKILQLSNLGDAAATNALKAIEDAEANKKSVDKLILEKAMALNLTDTSEQGILDFLWTQRCLFAHPYNLAPNIDETKYSINQLVKICLAKPLLFKRQYLNELVQNIVTKPFFLQNDEVEINKYYDGLLPRITVDQHPYLFKTLLGEFGKIDNETSKADIQVKLRLFIIKLLLDSTLPLSDDSWSLEHRAVNFPFTTFYGVVSPATWTKLPIRIKQILIDYALGEVDENKRYQIKNIFWNLIRNGVLEENFRTRYFDFLENISFNYAINFYADPSRMLGRILRQFDTHNYDKQNPVIEYLKSTNGKTFYNGLSEADQAALGRRITYAVRNNNWIGIDYFNSLPNQTDLPKGLIAGLVEGTLFDRNNKFYIALDKFYTTLKVLAKLDTADALDILDKIDNQITSTQDSTHHLEDESIDAAKNKFSELGQDIQAKAEGMLDHLKPFKYVFNLE